METINHYIEQANHILKEVKTSKIMNKLQLNSINKLTEINIPTRKVESWKNTNLTTLLKNNYEVDLSQTLPNEKTKNPIQQQIADDTAGCSHLYFLNGEFQDSISEASALNIIDLKDVSEQELSTYIELIDSDLKDDFSFHLNIASHKNGKLLRLDKDITLDKPIVIHHHYDKSAIQSNPFNIFHIGKSSKLDILEIYTSSEKSNALINPFHLILTESQAEFKHTLLQNCSLDTVFLNCLQASIKGEGQYKNINIHLGCELSRSYNIATLLEENAFTAVHGLYPLNGKQHHDTLAKIHHQAPKTYSEQLYKGIVADESKGIFTGKVLIDQIAQESDSKQLNKNLILSSKAHAFSRPQLEIYADDVKCAHGSTTGQLSEEELFYFMARGISKDKAQQLLTTAFANDVVLKIEHLLIQRYISEQLNLKEYL